MGLNGRTTLVIPAMWEPHLADGSVEEIFNTEQDGGRLFKARLASDPSLEVFIKEMPYNSAAWRESFISQRLRRQSEVSDTEGRGGSIITHFDVHWLPSSTCIFTESFNMSLEQLLARHQVRWPGMPKELMPPPRLRPTEGMSGLGLSESLPLLIDILRGVIRLDEAGVVHSALTPENIALKDGRAFIGGLSRSCVLGADNDEWLSSGALEENFAQEAGTFATSSMLTAPEMVYGRPTGPAVHIWGAALIYAQMRFGYNPVERLTATHFPENIVLRMHDMLADGREHIREHIREHFDIREDPSLHKLAEDERELLIRMLDVDPRKRLSARKALDIAIRMSIERSLHVPRERDLVGLPAILQKQVDRYGFFSDSYGHLDYFVDGLLAFEDQKRSAIIDDSHDDAVDGIDSLGWQDDVDGGGIWDGENVWE